ncbi:MAG: hypothetical protein LC747_01995, partial [Acidobacteria bacterium]|nr:hypothetical protein [Acidobacteriota bacterium]
MTDVISFILQPTPTLVTVRALSRTLAILCAIICAGAVVVCARTPSVRAAENDPTTIIVEGENTKDVFGLGRSVIVRGRVKHGVMTFGGDVIVEGRVEGDVGVIGGTIT